MQDVHLILVVVCSIAISIMLLHSFFVSRKERSKLFQDCLIKHRKQSNQNMPKSNGSPVFGNKSSEVKQSVSKLMFQKEKKRSALSTLHAINSQDKEIEQSFLAERDVINKQVVDPFQDTSVKNQNYKTSNVDINKVDINKKDLFVILHVAALQGQVLCGDLLLQSLFQSGFQFGENQIFHRHVDPSGSGHILFSLANMMKPGSFEPETMSNFTTPGISIFMIVPSFGNSVQNFKLMLQAAQCIAADVGGIVLDEDRKMLTSEMIEVYHSRIRNACT
ncbi:MAG: cell division protein ZipA [Candidatus Arsenophonus melophagi]|nr:cell division protein ZipA [Candidatus Arsenophonus melophagi]